MTTTHPHSRSPGDALTPHTRGLHPWPARRHQVHGIIPACAGFTHTTSLRSAVAPGSSPRVRGLRPGLRLPALRGRIIPARAGFTPRSSA